MNSFNLSTKRLHDHILRFIIFDKIIQEIQNCFENEKNFVTIQCVINSPIHRSDEVGINTIKKGNQHV